MLRRIRWRCRWACLIALGACGGLACAPRGAQAGGGPENLYLVVNDASWASKTVANHFIHLRQIPASNVLYLNWPGGAEGVDSATFRKYILEPILQNMIRRAIPDQIDYIIYSSDFPYTIGFTKELEAISKPQGFTTGVSINAATYLWEAARASSPYIAHPQSNEYARGIEVNLTNPEVKIKRETKFPSHGFRSWYGWGPEGDLLESGGHRYLLSTMLACTSYEGNSVREAVEYLRRSASADGTRPKGVIYYTKTSDIRTTVRADMFSQAIAQLKELGVTAVTIHDPLPVKRPDVAGLTMGAAVWSWPKSGSAFRPGAIADNLTSFGGRLYEGGGQTPLTEFLRYGAAGASGAVDEPTANPLKFPTPFLQVHYARGCTLAEAYYQSVYGPYQLLIVGDPLCRPWAKIPDITVPELTPGAKVSGTLELRPTGKVADGKVDRYELFVDGTRQAMAMAGQGLTWDSTSVGDGYHELRVVGIDASPIETQGRLICPVAVDNRGRTIEFTSSPEKSVRWGETLTLHAKAPGMIGILFMHNGRVIGQIKGAEGDATVKPALLGLGPVEIEAVGLGSDEKDSVRARPVALNVEPTTALPGIKPPGELVRGLTLKLADGKTVPVQTTAIPNWLATAGVQANQKFQLDGYVTLLDEDTYQFQVWHSDALQLAVDGRPIYRAAKGNFGAVQFVPVTLAKGTHLLQVVGVAGSPPQLRVLFGGNGTRSLDGTDFRHPKK